MIDLDNTHKIFKKAMAEYRTVIESFESVDERSYDYETVSLEEVGKIKTMIEWLFNFHSYEARKYDKYITTLEYEILKRLKEERE